MIDSLAVRIVGGLFEYSESPRETETKFEPPHEVEFFITRAMTPNFSIYVELEYGSSTGSPAVSTRVLTPQVIPRIIRVNAPRRRSSDVGRYGCRATR